MIKSKYLKRTGTPGNYRYTYKEGEKKESSKINEIVSHANHAIEIIDSIKDKKFTNEQLSSFKENANAFFNSLSRIGGKAEYVDTEEAYDKVEALKKQGKIVYSSYDEEGGDIFVVSIPKNNKNILGRKIIEITHNKIFTTFPKVWQE
jgi:hypothetical protein